MDNSQHEEDKRVEKMTEKLQKSLSIDSEEMDTYQRYIKEGKDAARQGDMRRSLELFTRAYALHPSDKVKGRMQRLQEAIKELARGSEGEEDEEEEFVDVNGSGLMLYRELYDKLYEHQKEGVAFLYGLHREGRKGGILADDMGLGKTIQVISFLSGMYDAELVKHILLIMPTSLIKNWVREFATWTPGMRVKEFHGTNKAERTRNLERIQRRGGVIITTYQMLINNCELLASSQGSEFHWDYVILDEAHKIKTSSTKTAKSCHAIPARNRLLLTGTPVQNNLREMWALFDFACQGALLGTSKTFKTEYENPITRAREKDSTPGEKALGLRISENLTTIIGPYFLRRTKAEVQSRKQDAAKARAEEEENAASEDKENQAPRNGGGSTQMPTLTRKNDLIIWTYLSPVQEDIYNQFISLDHIKELLMTTRSPLAELTVLKKLCDHPRLLSARAIAQLGLEEGDDPDHLHDGGEAAASCRIDHIPDETLIAESGKLRFLIALLERLREEGHRTLVFSQSRKMLDIVERVLRNRGFNALRVDGTVTHLVERERRIALFQTDRRYSVFLLTTQVGGVGITLTAANRVVIFDPSWNPATDAQAVDRAYRIGQTENVLIYRLITCGTVEEKIYRRQVFKDSLIRQTTGDKKNPFRYFSKQELKELFKLEDTRSSSTQLQLQSLHAHHRRTDPTLDLHIAYLHTMEMFGISDHDLMFSNEDADGEEPEDAEADLYIANRVQKAQELVKAESELHGQLMDSVAQNTEPAWLRTSNQRDTSGQRGRVSNPRPSPPPPAYSHPPVVVDLTQSGSSLGHCSQEEEEVQNISNKLFDLSVAEEVDLVSEEEVIKSEPLKQPDQERSDGEEANDSVQEVGVTGSAHRDEDHVVVLEDSVNMSSASSITGPDEHILPFPKLDDLSVHLDSPVSEKSSAVKSPKNPRLSILQMSNLSLRSPVEGSFKMAAEVESFQGNFNLQLEDSGDMFQEEEVEKEEEEEESSEAFQLQMEASLNAEARRVSSRPDLQDDLGDDLCDLERNPSKREQSFNLSAPADDSILHSVRKKKKSQVISDSEEEEEEEVETEENSEVLELQMEASLNAEARRVSSRPDLQDDLGDDLSDLEHNPSKRERSFNLSAPANDSILHSVRKKKKAQVIYDSEEEEEEKEEEERKPQKKAQVIYDSEEEEEKEEEERIRQKKAQVIYDSEEEEAEHPCLSSTPLAASRSSLFASTPNRRHVVGNRKSVGGNVSVASRRSFVESVLEDVEDLDEEMESSLANGTHADQSDTEGEESSPAGAEPSEAAEADGTPADLSVMEEEEPSGETLNTENGEGEGMSMTQEEEEMEEGEEEEESLLEESTGDLELASTEAMDQCAPKNHTPNQGATASEAKAGAVAARESPAQSEGKRYESLVWTGRQCYSQGKLQEALNSFLSAIDIRSGDPEIQLMTIQLYRQLSQQSKG